MDASIVTGAGTGAGALQGLLVFEIGRRIGVSVAGSLLAQLGATVVVLEADNATGAKWQHRDQYLAGKLSLSDGDVVLQRRLLQEADAVLLSPDVDSNEPSSDCGIRPGAQVRCEISAFGRGAAQPDAACSELALQAVTGILCTTGREAGPAVPIPLPLLETLTGTQAAAAVLLALRVARQTGQGQDIDMAIHDCGFAAMSSFFSRLFEEGGTDAAFTRLGNLHSLSAPWNVYAASDGWAMVCTGSNLQWQRLCRAIGCEAAARDPRYSTPALRVAHVREVDALLQDWMRTRLLSEVLAQLSAADVPVGQVTSIDDYPRDDNLALRGMLCTLQGAGQGWTPGSPLRMRRTPGQPLTQVPEPGGSSAEVAAALAAHTPRAGLANARPRQPGAPLAGLTVIEIGHYTTAPVAARSFGALGARVIKVEPPGGEASRGWDPSRHGQSIFYTLSNTDKLGVTIDLNDAGDRRCLRQLLAGADVLIENLKPGALARAGFDPQTLARINPQLVACSISGFGAYSLYGQRPAFDTVVQAMGGVMSLIQDQNMPLKAGISYADILGAAMAQVAVLAALEERATSGLGQAIDLSMQDIVAWSTQAAWNQGRAPFAGAAVVLACTDGEVLVEDGAQLSSAARAAAAEMTREDFVQRHGGVPVRVPSEVLARAARSSRRLCFELNDERGVWPALAVPMGLLDTPPCVSRPAPALGGDNQQVLGMLRGLAQHESEGKRDEEIPE